MSCFDQNIRSKVHYLEVIRLHRLGLQVGFDLVFYLYTGILSWQSIVQTAKRGVSKHDYTAVHGILPILRYLLAVEKDFDETLQVYVKLLQLSPQQQNFVSLCFGFMVNPMNEASIQIDEIVLEIITGIYDTPLSPCQQTDFCFFV